MDSALRKQLKDTVWCKKVWKVPSISTEAQKLISQCSSLTVPEPSTDLTEVIANSKKFPIPFPIDTVRLEKLKLKYPVEKLSRNIASTYPIVHERVVLLIANFLLYKRKYGSDIEKELYKTMTIPEFIDRILKKRAITFIKAQDQYKLINGHEGYDEMKISALVSVSGHTQCINDGKRKNAGVVNEEGIEKDAVIIGVIGPRFKRKQRMEYEDMLVTQEQNIPANGYGDCTDEAKKAWRQLWDEFYQNPSTTHTELTSHTPLIPCTGRRMFGSRWARVRTFAFDNERYCRRISVLADVVLLEADVRGEEEGKSAFLNVIGAGLGLWKVSGRQLDVYILTFLERIVSLLDTGKLKNVADVNFAYIKPGKEVAAFFKDDRSTGDSNPSCKKLFIKNESHPRGGINVQLEDREPSSSLGAGHDKLLVLTYAWDSNAHPGNEFWIGKLSSSGDSAAACSAQIAELHNAHINTAVTGVNTRIASDSVTTLPQYCVNLVSKLNQ